MEDILNDVSMRTLKAGKILDTINCGKFEVIDTSGGWEVIHIKFLDTGFTTDTQISNIRRGTIKDGFKVTVMGVGFIGNKKKRGSLTLDEKQATDIWRCMLARCYSEKYQKIQPSYIGCTVDPHWHNLQNFIEWYMGNYPKDGKRYQLDKDIRYKGNKIYSAATCCFVTQRVNTQVANQKSYRVTRPSGEVLVVTNMSSFCRKNKLQSATMHAIASNRYKSPFGWLVERL